MRTLTVYVITPDLTKVQRKEYESLARKVYKAGEEAWLVTFYDESSVIAHLSGYCKEVHHFEDGEFRITKDMWLALKEDGGIGHVIIVHTSEDKIASIENWFNGVGLHCSLSKI